MMPPDMQGMMQMMQMMGAMQGMMGWMQPWMVLGWLTTILFYGALIVLAAWLITRLRRIDESGGARRLLDERFARGEIDTEEYERRRHVLIGR